jgi:hypothetical protein
VWAGSFLIYNQLLFELMVIVLYSLKRKKMQEQAKSIRPFIGAKNYNLSRSFYVDLGFQESILSDDMSLFKTDRIGFYLQKAYVKDWINNLMVFVEVDDVENYWKELVALDLTTKYRDVKLTPIKSYDWGKECFVHDPSGVLWHFGQFNRR